MTDNMPEDDLRSVQARNSELAVAFQTDAAPNSHNPESNGEGIYSVFTRPEKWFIVALVSYGSLFSPLTTSIYLVAIPTLSSTFQTSIERINLSVTVYMVAQAVCKDSVHSSFF
jgi:hypothetical protein